MSRRLDASQLVHDHAHLRKAEQSCPGATVRIGRTGFILCGRARPFANATFAI
jgi:hypothetical protein